MDPMGNWYLHVISGRSVWPHFFSPHGSHSHSSLFFKAAKAPGSQQMASSMRNIERALWVSRGDIKVGPKKPMVIIEIEITTYK